MSQTWIIKDNAPVDGASLTLVTTNISFTTNNQKETSIGIEDQGGVYVLIYSGIGDVAGYDPGLGPAFVWNNEAYKTLEFDTAPTGELLAWLQKNADEQSDPEYLTRKSELTKVANAIRAKSGTSDPLVYPDEQSDPEYLTRKSELTKVANAIRAKSGTSDPLVYPDGFVTAIQAIQIGTKLKIIVTVKSGATVTATKGSLSVSGISVNGTCTLVVPEGGEWSVKATLSGQTSDTKNITFTDSYVMSFSLVSTVLNDNDWSKIKEVSDKGEGANYWSIGDRKAVTVRGTVGTQAVNGTYYVYIIGFNHNSSKEGNGITFGTFKTALSGGTDICLIDGKYGVQPPSGTKYFSMNHSSETNSGGWKGCDLRYDVLGSTNTNDGDATATTATNPVANTLMAALPSDLRAVMQPMTIYTDNTGGGSDNASYVTKTTDYLPLLAEYEIFGTRKYANSTEKNYQAQYAYYSAGNSKVKYRHSTTSYHAWWWERSPAYKNSVYFCGVSTNGGVSCSSARGPFGIAPIFRI